MHSLGLALCGGGSKGIAHAGILKFLIEQELEPQVLSGTSAGAIVACLYAKGLTPDEIVEFFKSVYFFRWNHFSITKPGGFIQSDVFQKYLDPIFGEQKIKELSKEVYITATNMLTGKLEVFSREVKITDAIIASCAVPMIATPYKIGEGLYSDGGILNNFPADVLKYLARKIIGVYFSPRKVVEPEEIRSIMQVTSRAYDLMSSQSEISKASVCDWFINPAPLFNYNMFEGKKSRMEEIFKIGYEEAKKRYDPELFS